MAPTTNIQNRIEHARLVRSSMSTHPHPKAKDTARDAAESCRLRIPPHTTANWVNKALLAYQ